jgi:hypothetical protein
MSNENDGNSRIQKALGVYLRPNIFSRSSQKPHTLTTSTTPHAPESPLDLSWTRPVTTKLSNVIGINCLLTYLRNSQEKS